MSTSPGHQAPLSITQEMARFVDGLTLDDVPPEVQEIAIQHFLDATGIALAATGMNFGRAAALAAESLGEGGRSRIIGFDTQVSAASAALANGVLIHGLDFDDTHIGAIYHATAPALTTALAVGEAEGSDGRSVLLAYIIGLEIGCRVAAVGAGQFHARGFHPTGIAGTFAAACVAAKLRGSSSQSLVNALGLCGSQAAGVLEVGESWLKRFHPGWAAHAGIVAVAFADSGFLGPATILEGRRGVFATHLGEAANLEAFGSQSLGRVWMAADIALKPYPCCHFTHAFIDAAGLILEDLHLERINPNDVTGIHCAAPAGVFASVVEPVEVKVAPKTLYQSLFSIQYAVALRLVRGSVDLAAFYDEAYDEPATLAMAAKVVCRPDEHSEFPQRFDGEVSIELADGTVLSKRVNNSYGSPQWPLDAAGVATKYDLNARRALPAERADRVKELVTNIRQVPDIRALVQACALNHR